MIHYHGMPLSGPTQHIGRFLRGRHAFVSFAAPKCLPTVAKNARTFAIDNGAFSAWKRGEVVDWSEYRDFIQQWRYHPGFDWCVIPDVIDGTAEDNDKMIEQWGLPATISVPVWHLHEPIKRLVWLAGAWPRVAFGSSGEYAKIGTEAWTDRMHQAMQAVCGIIEGGRPICKLHGLRMLAKSIVRRFPFSSCDSTNAARNAAYEQRFKTYPPEEAWQRAETVAWSVESEQSAECYRKRDKQRKFDMFDKVPA